MAASDKLLEQINRTVNQFQVSRHGELVSDPLTIRMINKSGTQTFDVVVDGKLIYSGLLENALDEADHAEKLTKEARQEFLSDKPVYQG